MTAYTAVGRSIFRGSVYYVTIALAAQIAVDLNYRWAPHAPIAFLLGLLAVVVWTATLGRRWSGYSLLKVSARRDIVAAYSTLAVLLCLGVFVVAGRFSHLVSGFPPAPEGTRPGWQVSAALFTGAFAGIVEEVAFRGILQGNLARAFDPRVAVAVATAAFCALHAWRSGFAAQLAFYAALGLSTGLIAHIARSAAPGMSIHLATNTLLAVAALVWGPLEWARMSSAAAWVGFVVIGLSVAGMVVMLRRLRSLELLSQRLAAVERSC
jgi:membrane protease YdiL (CAAX protease family)